MLQQILSLPETSLDLVALVADHHIDAVLRALLCRFWPGVRFHLLRGMGDPDVFFRAEERLRPFIRRARYALVVMDFRWDRPPNLRSPDQIQEELRSRLSRSGWQDRCEVIVIDPEVEVWLWADPHLIVEWLDPNRKYPIQSLFPVRNTKPAQPKEELDRIIRQINHRYRLGVRMKTELYKWVAEKVPKRLLETCADPAFSALRWALSSWFGPWR